MQKEQKLIFNTITPKALIDVIAMWIAGPSIVITASMQNWYAMALASLCVFLLILHKDDD